MEFTKIIGGWAGGALNGVVLLVFIAVVCALIGFGAWAYYREKRYKEYTIIVWFRDAVGNMHQSVDFGGVFLDKKTNNKRLFLKFANVGLSADAIPFVPGAHGRRFVYVYRNGLKNFVYLRPQVDLSTVKIKVGEEDVNWAVNSYERAKKLFTASTLLQYMPFILLAFVSIIILVVFIYFFKDFKYLKEMAASLAEASKAFAAAQSGTAVLPA